MGKFDDACAHCGDWRSRESEGSSFHISPKGVAIDGPVSIATLALRKQYDSVYMKRDSIAPRGCDRR